MFFSSSQVHSTNILKCLHLTLFPSFLWFSSTLTSSCYISIYLLDKISCTPYINVSNFCLKGSLISYNSRSFPPLCGQSSLLLILFNVSYSAVKTSKMCIVIINWAVVLSVIEQRAHDQSYAQFDLTSPDLDVILSGQLSATNRPPETLSGTGFQ